MLWLALGIFKSRLNKQDELLRIEVIDNNYATLADN